MKQNTPCVLTIAGSDSSGGAGIQADIKSLSAIGCYAASVITSVTAQNTQDVYAIYDLPSSIIQSQLEAVLNDLSIESIKIGMLHTSEIIHCLYKTLKKRKLPYIVLDPVMLSKSGKCLLEKEAVLDLEREIFPLAQVITPNIPEAICLLGKPIRNEEEQALAAEALSNKFHTSFLIKGGHSHHEEANDVLFHFEKQKWQWYRTKKIPTQNTHGTGCSLSSAIAGFLAKSQDLEEAIHLAKAYVQAAISHAKDLKIGQGKGPIHHFFLSRDQDPRI